MVDRELCQLIEDSGSRLRPYFRLSVQEAVPKSIRLYGASVCVTDGREAAEAKTTKTDKS